MKVLVGTASWSGQSLVQPKKFYPADLKTPEGALRCCATQFPVAEPA